MMNNRKRLMKVITALTGAAMTASLAMLTVHAEGEAASGGGSAIGGLLSTLALPVLLLVFLYFIMIRPQQKAEKQTREMQKNLRPGDEVVTIGGIVGFVLRVEDNTKTVVLETGSDRLKIRLMQDAIKENVTAREALEAEKAAKKKGAGLAAKPKDE